MVVYPILKRARIQLLASVFHKRIETGVLVCEVTGLCHMGFKSFEVSKPLLITVGELVEASPKTILEESYV